MSLEQKHAALSEEIAKIRQHLLETTNVFARLEILSNEVVALTERVGKPGRAN